MRVIFTILILLLCGCSKTDSADNNDPFESTNRRIFKFNKAFDATMIKPPATIYKAILPPQVRTSISNAYDNVQMLPTIANDILQGELLLAYKDGWRLLINTTIGVGGLFDVASKWNLPKHNNDLGITLAKWGDRDSPYIVLPLLGPSTLRDTTGLLFDYRILSVYPHIKSQRLLYSLLLLRYVDLRASLLDKEAIIEEALDEYSFIRDAYMQNRNYQINGERGEIDPDSIYIEGEEEGEAETTPPLKVIEPPLRS